MKMGMAAVGVREQVRQMNLTREEREACMQTGPSAKGLTLGEALSHAIKTQSASLDRIIQSGAEKAATGEEIGTVKASSVVVILDSEVKRCRVGRAKEGWFLRVETRRGVFGSTGWPTAAAATGVMGLFLRTGYLIEKAAGPGRKG